MLELDPKLSPDVEWMLLGPQISPELLIEALADELGADLYDLAYALLGDARQAEQTVSDTLLAAVKQRSNYREGNSVKAWLFHLEIEICRKKAKPGGKFKLKFSRHLAQDSKTDVVEGASKPPDRENDLRHAFDELPTRARLIILLHFLFGLGKPEIAIALGISIERVETGLHIGMSLFERRTFGLVADSAEGRKLIHGALRNGLSNRVEAEPKIDRLIVQLKAELASRRIRKQRKGNLQQAGLILLMLLFIAIAGRFTQMLASTASPHPNRVTEVVITRLVAVKVPVTTTPKPTATPSPTPPVLESLIFNADEERIRERIGQSRALAGQLWVDAQIVEYGPSGYIGSPRTYRTQMWIQDWSPSNPTQQRLVLSGSIIRPETAFYIQDKQSYEIDLLTGLSYQYSPELLEGAIFNQNDPRLAVAPNVRQPGRQSLQDGTFLSGLLFGSWFSTEGGSLEIAFTDRSFGRDVLVINRVVDGLPRERAWIDALTGMTFRWESYADFHQMVVGAEMHVLNLEYEARFPEEAVSSTFFWRQPVTWESVRHDGAPGSLSASLVELNPRGRLSTDNLPPLDFDPAGSKLEFQWEAISRPAAQPGTQVEIFADGYFLGRVEMGVPWNLFCERSPDGMIVAFQEAAPNEEGLLYAPTGPRWIDLADPDVVHNALPNAEIASSDFAFSPDSRYLAFWGCAVRPDNCGIYVHDVQNQKNRKLMEISHGALFFQWSPDGQFLAFIGAGSTLNYSTSLLVLDVEYGQRVFESQITLPYMPIPGDSPTRQWGLPFPPPRTSLEGCTR